MADACLLAVGDDEVLGRGAVREERLGDRLLEALGGERLAVEVEDAVDLVGRAEQVCSGARARLCRDLCTADALELPCRLRAAPRGEERPVDVEDDACGAQPIGELEREPGRDDRLPDTELRTCPRRDLEHRRVGIEAVRDVLIETERLERENGHPLDLAHSRRLERANHRVAVAVSLDVEERVGDGVGHLDSELGTPHRVSEDEDARHRSSLSGALSQDCGDPARKR